MSNVFVFGSNTMGWHGAGAAKSALKFYGAKYGQGVGRQGNSYAIPTKGPGLVPLPFEIVAANIAVFLDYARQNPEDNFNVTRVGCGLAGFNESQIAPLFKDAPPNCNLPIGWRTP